MTAVQLLSSDEVCWVRVCFLRNMKKCVLCPVMGVHIYPLFFFYVLVGRFPANDVIPAVSVADAKDGRVRDALFFFLRKYLFI